MLGGSSSLDLQITSVVSLSSKPHTCNECGRACRDQGRLQEHMRLHTGEKPHSCIFCPKTFRTREEVRVHHRTHTGERPYKCSLCDLRFNQANARTKHIKVFHGKGNDKKITYLNCSECSALFYRKSDLGKHLKRHDNGMIVKTIDHLAIKDEASLNQAIIKQEAIEKNTLDNGEKISSLGLPKKVENNYSQCRDCARFFTSEKHLREHECVAKTKKTVKTEETHVAQQLNKSTAKAPKKLNQRAAKKPRREPKFECNLCGRRVHAEIELDRHIRSVHYNLKEFACSLCSRQFGWKSAWKKHMRVVHKVF